MRMRNIYLSGMLLSATMVSAEQTNKIDDDEIEEITVYAQKRAQDARDVSVYVNVLNEELLKQLNLKDTSQLSAQIPNAKITTNTGEGAPPVINLRGVGSLDYNNTTTAPVAVYVDNVVGGALSNSLIYMFDMAQVEVLKGPQGTLFGRNTNGGAILLQTKRPEAVFGGYVQLGLGNHDHDKQEAVLNLPLGDNTAMRIGASRQDYEYTSNNIQPGAPQAGMRQNNYRLSISHEGDNFDIFFKLSGADWDGNVKPARNKGFIGPAGCREALAGTQQCTDAFGFNVPSDDPQTVMSPGITPHTTEKTGATLQWTWRINDRHELFSITATSDLDRLHTFDCDNSPTNACFGDLGVENDLFSQELRLHSEFGEHYLISGLFYINEEIIQDNQIDLFRDFRPVLAAGPAHFMYDNTVDIESIAAFSQLDYKINDNYTLTAGLRFTDESTNYTAKSDLNVPTAAGDLVGATLTDFWNLSGEQADSKFSGKVALVQKLNDEVNMYYSISKGFKSGGYNGGLAFSADEARLSQYGPETLLAYEMGSKMLFSNGARLNVAAFYYDYNDQQIFMNQQSNEALSAPAQVIDNVGESTIYGIEADYFYAIDNNWLLQFGIGYIPKAELSEYEDAQGNRLRNHRLPYTSKVNINGLLNYTTGLGEGDFKAQLEFDYQSDFYFDQNQNPLAEQDAHTLWNARVSYVHNESWEVSGWVKNLTDEVHSSIIFDMGEAFGLLQDLKADGRKLGVEITYYF